ncbi:MAG: B12-binding domain-containing radical SAM protein, partial [Planctomycetes bacterium]|nr:B12-binding domain-containing radical SAM protein [Planctomycetota bacterium]
LAVMIGGFHVSGAIAMSTRGMPPECQQLLDAGVTLVKGEVEECWGDLLRDALHDRLRSFYDIAVPPDISRAALPAVQKRIMRRYAYPFMGTLDAGRGCPFNCSFCTIINVQGRKMRHRRPADIVERIRQNAKSDIDYYFFTDDNFSRNPDWEEILDGILELRRKEGIRVHFMMQIDTLAYRIPNFISKAAEAGCSQVFIGMETLNPENLPAAGKRQNHVEDYRKMIDAWHEAGIVCHVGYIIGFPFDTEESVREDVRRLREEIGVDQASFFMLTPLPGSADHQRMQERGEWMDDDLNRYDSFHPALQHSRMSHEAWSRAYRDAWRNFYTVDSMKKILARARETNYWSVFNNFVWYRHSAVMEDTHPMICGFFPLKDRKQRRPGHAVDPLWRHAIRRTRETLTFVRKAFRLYFEMQEVWLATRGRARLRQKVDRVGRRYELIRQRLSDALRRAEDLLDVQRANAWAGAAAAGREIDRLRRGTIREIVRCAKTLERLRRRISLGGMPRWTRWASWLNPFSVRTSTRAHLDEYWRSLRAKLDEGQLLRINPLKLAVNFVRDLRLCAIFSLSFILSQGR